MYTIAFRYICENYGEVDNKIEADEKNILNFFPLKLIASGL